MEEESKMSFIKRWKTSIFNLENYHNLAMQKIVKTIGYVAILALIFAFIMSSIITYKFHNTIRNIGKYIDEKMETVSFVNGVLSIKAKDKPDEAIVIENEDILDGKIIIDTKDLEEEKIENYKKEINGYYNGIIVLKDRIIIKSNDMLVGGTIFLQDVSEQFHIVNVQKHDIVDFAKGQDVYSLDIFFLRNFIYNKLY